MDFNKFRKILNEEKDKIILTWRTKLEEINISGDEADEANAHLERHLILKMENRQKNLLQKIEAALQRIKEGTFGECEGCGDEIGEKRLETRPTATLCINCKEKEEKAEKIFLKVN